MELLKHQGRTKSTNKKCFVAYRTIPGESNHALIVLCESLPDNWYNSMNQLLMSSPAQNSFEFADILNRSSFNNGANMLQELHLNGRLVKWKTNDVEMIPHSNVQPILLSEMNQMIANNLGIPVDELCNHGKNPTDTKPPVNNPVEVPEMTKPIVNISSDDLKTQAQLLMDKANELLKMAETMKMVDTKEMAETMEISSDNKIVEEVSTTVKKTRQTKPKVDRVVDTISTISTMSTMIGGGMS